MGKPKAPRPPDPNVTAGAQTATNIGTAIAQQGLNNVNQVTPYGSLNYEQTGNQQFTDPNTGKTYDIPNYTATQTLSGDQQAILDQNNQAQMNISRLGAEQSGRLSEFLGNDFSLDGQPQAGDASSIRGADAGRVGGADSYQRSIADAGPITKSYGTDFSQDRQRVEDALMQRLNPSLRDDRRALEQRMADQGIGIGSKAYSSSMDDFNRGSNDARLGAILTAGQEQSRLTGLESERARFENSAQGQQFGQNAAQANTYNQGVQGDFSNQLAGGQFNNAAARQDQASDLTQFNAANTARDRGVQEAFAMRNQPLNEASSLMSGSQVRNPSFVNNQSAQLPFVDVAGLTQANFGAQQNQYNQQMDQWNSTTGGIMGLGSALIMSDRRTKEDIKKVGKTDDGQNVYSYKYKHGGPTQIGLMAQEVKKKKPEAVTTLSGGIMAVDYGKALS